MATRTLRRVFKANSKYAGSVLAETPSGGIRLGLENGYYPFSALGSATETQAVNAGVGVGTAGAQFGLQFPVSSSLNVPATTFNGGGSNADHWYFVRYKTPSAGQNVPNSTTPPTTMESILSTTGGPNGSLGGSFGMGALTYYDATGGATTSTGTYVPTNTQGMLYLRRQGASLYQMFAQTTPGYVTGGAVYHQPSTAYGAVIGTKYDGVSAWFGRAVVAQVGGSTPESVSAPTASNNTRPTTTQLFNYFGNANCPAGGTVAGFRNFSGELHDVWICTGPFPTDAQVQALTNGTMTMKQVAAANGNTTILYHNTCDMSTASGGVIPADPAYTVTTGMTVMGATATLPVGCGPLMGNGVINLTRMGPHMVWPAPIGYTDGQVWFEGTTTPGVSLQARMKYVDGGFSPWYSLGVVPPSGTFARSIRIPWKRNGYRQIQVVGRPDTLITDYDLHAVGWAIPWFSQSEGGIQLGSGATYTSTTITDTVNSGSGHIIPAAFTGPTSGSPNAPFASFIDNRTLSTSGTDTILTKGTVPGIDLITGNANPGDGLTILANAIMNSVGVSVIFHSFAHYGSIKDYVLWTARDMVFTGTIGAFALPSGTSGTGPYAFTPAMTTAMAQAITGSPDIVVGAAFNQQIKEGTVVITFSDGSVVVDDNAAVGGTPYSIGGFKTLTGSVVVDTAIANSFVNYCTASNKALINLALLSNPNAATIVKIVLQYKQETGDASATQKTTFINGWGGRELFNQRASVAARFGYTAAIGYWQTSEANEKGSSVQGIAKDQIAKWTMLKQIINNFAYPSVDSGLLNWNMLLQPKGRDMSTADGTISASNDTIRAANQAMWNGGQYGVSWMYPGLFANDLLLWGPSQPHQSPGPNGTHRLAERMALSFVAMVTNSPLASYTWGTPIIGTGLNGWAANQIAIPINGMINGETLVADIANGNGGAHGTGTTTWWVSTSPLNNNAANGTGGGHVDNGAYATLSVSGHFVVLTKVVGNWLGSETVRYCVGGPGLNTGTPCPYYFNDIYVTGGLVPTMTYSAGFPMPPLFYMSGGNPHDQYP